MPLTVRERRAHWKAVEEDKDTGWVCDRCGEDDEERLVLWDNGRMTRNGSKTVCLCDKCEAVTGHGRFIDQ